MSKKSRKRDEDDGVFDEDDDDDAESVDRSVGKAAVSKKRKKQSFIDDAAEESGDDAADNEDDEEDDDDNNDYVKDDFVVDEEDEGVTKKKDDLEDSDDEISDEENDDAHLKKIKKVRVTDRLDEDDLALINEARGISAVDLEDDDILEVAVPVEKPRKRVVATTEEELQKGLFYDSGDEVDEQEQREEASKDKAQRKPMRVERYDEDGMDDFIEDDIGDQDAIRMSDRKNYDCCK
jgi:Acidic N-terminal SPT6